MKKPFSLELLFNKLDNTEFNSSKTWLKMRITPENRYIAFYKSGKFLITGLKNFKELNKVKKKVLDILKENNIENSFADLKISNIVLKDSIKLKSSLEDILVSLNSTKVSYEPEQFPGLFYKEECGINYTLFSSGKIIITGVKDIELAEIKLNKFKELILRL